MTRRSLPFRALAVAYLAMGVFPLANLLRPNAVRWWAAATDEWILRGTTLVLVAALCALVGREHIERLLAALERALMRPSARVFALVVSLAAAGIAASLAWYCFAGLPFTSDEMAQQWHARILLSGHLAAVAEPAREFFNTAPVFDSGGRWFSQYPVGGPAFIALGLALPGGAAWLVNPALLGVATWQLYAFLRLAATERAARVATLLFVASPMVLIMGASQMNHVPALAFTLVALAALARWDAAPDSRTQRRHAAVVGAAVGIVALVRPLDAAIVGALIGAMQLWRLRGASAGSADAKGEAVGVAGRRASILWTIAAGAVPVALLLWANARTTGSPFLFGYEALNGPAHAMGFHVDPNGEMHTPLRGLALASGYLMRLSRYLFEWPIPAVLIVAAGLAAIPRPTRWDALLAALSAAFLAAYGAYWFDGFFAGPRFLYTAVPAFIYFAARAPEWIAESRLGAIADLRRTVLLVVPLCVAAAWLGPAGVSSARARVASYHEQRTKLKTDVDGQLARAGLRHALVFVNEGWRGRLEARLRVLGVTQFRAERVLSSVDACALQTALDAEDSSAAGDARARAERAIATAAAFGRARLEPGLQADQAIALVPDTKPTPECLHEFLRDTAGTISYPVLLARQHVGRDGRIGGGRSDVVFARDLGARDTVLRARFGDRAWYRYRVPRSLADTTPAFVPYR